MALAVGHPLYSLGHFFLRDRTMENLMSTESSLYARDLLKVALELLDDEESLTAVAMISGAIDMLDRRAIPVTTGGDNNWSHMIHLHAGTGSNRSCA